VAPALARALNELGKHDQVVRDLDPARVGDPKAKALLLVERGRAQLVLRRAGEAKASFDQAAELVPDLPEGRIAQAQLRFADGDLEGTGRIVDEVLARTPGHLGALLLKADVARAAGRRDEALEVLQKAVAASPRHAPSRSALVQVLIDSEKYDEARKQAADLRKLDGGGVMGQFMIAQIELRQRNFVAARDAVNQVLKFAPTYAPALMISGAAEFALGAYRQSELAVRKVIDQAPGSVYARRLLAAALLGQGRAAEADAVIKPVIDAKVQDPVIFALAGDIALRSRDNEGARKLYAQASQLAPENPQLLTSLALSEVRSGNVDTGIAELEKAAQLDGSNARPDVALVLTHLRARQWDKAMQAVRALEKKQPKNPLTFNLEAAVNLGKRDFKAARASLEKAVALQPNYMPAVLNLAALDVQERKVGDAQRRLEAVLKSEPNNLQALTALARLKVLQRAPRAEVGELLEKAQKGNPDQLEPRLALIRFLLEGKEYPKAAALALETQTRFPQSPQALEALGQVQLANNEKNQALVTMRKLVAEHPKRADSHEALARAQLASDDVDGARRSYRQALAINPRAREALIGLVRLEVRAGRTGEALKVAQDLQKAEPKLAAAYALEGDILINDKKATLALAAYRKALALEKDSSALFIKVHGAMLAAKQAGEAEKQLAAWIGQHPNDLVVRIYAGDRRLADKDYEGAKTHYRAILERQPQHVAALNNLAWAMRQSKDPAALETAEKAYRLQPGNAAIADTYGMVLLDAGQTDKALGLLKGAVESSPASGNLRLHYAEALVKAGRKDEAKKQLESALSSGRTFSGEQEARALLSTL
jgi:putative PEP-CTERM system TPR-repeat lipoprotein